MGRLRVAVMGRTKVKVTAISDCVFMNRADNIGVMGWLLHLVGPIGG
jgi:hypothetical protein